LTRALTWWRRNVKWFIVDDSYEVNIEFDESPIAKYTNLKIDPENLNEDNVISLQRLFKEIGFYNWEEDWIWDNIKDIFINFQIENGIISSINDIQAGYFWPKTYSYLQEKYWKSSWLFVEKYFEAKEKIKEISQSDNFSTLTTIQVQNMNAVKWGLEKILEKKYGLNIIKISSFKTKLKSALTQIANSSKYLNKKDEFLYLAEIL
jgi:hypothetical protein